MQLCLKFLMFASEKNIPIFLTVLESSVEGQHGRCLSGNLFGRAGESTQKPRPEGLGSPQRTVIEEVGGEGTLLFREGTELSREEKPMGAGDCVRGRGREGCSPHRWPAHPSSRTSSIPVDKMEALLLWGWYHLQRLKMALERAKAS